MCLNITHIPISAGCASQRPLHISTAGATTGAAKQDHLHTHAAHALTKQALAKKRRTLACACACARTLAKTTPPAGALIYDTQTQRRRVNAVAGGGYTLATGAAAVRTPSQHTPHNAHHIPHRRTAAS